MTRALFLVLAVGCAPVASSVHVEGDVPPDLDAEAVATDFVASGAAFGVVVDPRTGDTATLSSLDRAVNSGDFGLAGSASCVDCGGVNATCAGPAGLSRQIRVPLVRNTGSGAIDVAYTDLRNWTAVGQDCDGSSCPTDIPASTTFDVDLFGSLTACASFAVFFDTTSVDPRFRTITIDNAYGDWAGVPVAASDPLDNAGAVDLADVQIANDLDFLYVRNTYHSASSLNTFLSIDVDENPATGFDVAGLGLVGAEASWQNDFPFTSSTGVFNDGNGMSGEFFGSGAALLQPFANATSRELAISLDIVRNVDGSPVFPDDTIRLLFWTDSGAGDVVLVTYTLATP